MTLTDLLHPEDIKAAIRKRHGSMAEFERAEGLARQSVSEVLRGRPSRRAEEAIRHLLREQAGASESINPVCNGEAATPHRLSAGAR